RQRGFLRPRDESGLNGYIRPSSYSAQCHSSGFINSSSLGSISNRQQPSHEYFNSYFASAVPVLRYGVHARCRKRSLRPSHRNCAQCKKMFGPYFLGQKCADSCVKYKGKLIPDCEDEGSIQPFLQALDSDY
ncbi:unnamed protein product, partial [Heterotrigona itama]